MKESEVRKIGDPEDRLGSVPRHRHRRHHHRKRRRRLTIPAPVVFYLASGFLAASTGLVYLRGDRFLPVLIGAGIVALVALIINEASNFARSKRLRRSDESRVNFNKLEIVVLFGLLMVGFYVGIIAWAT